MRRLRERFGDERLRVIAAEAFFDARSIGRDHRYREYEWRAIWPGQPFSALLRIAAACMLVLPPEDLHLRMEDHLPHLARDYRRSSMVTYEPNAMVCSSLLRRVPVTEENLALAERALRGEVPGAHTGQLFESVVRGDHAAPALDHLGQG